MTRTRKIAEAKQLLSQDNSSLLADVTKEELEFLEQHGFNTANFLKYEASSIFTGTAEEEARCDAILSKIKTGNIIHTTLYS